VGVSDCFANPRTYSVTVIREVEQSDKFAADIRSSKKSVILVPSRAFEQHVAFRLASEFHPDDLQVDTAAIVI
jgi:hypothetical protein